MKDGYYLLSYKINGIKNLDVDVKLDFYKKTIDKDFDIREYNVKGIYGENGTGKSAIITSVKVLKNLMLNRYYLIDSKNRILFKSLFNKKAKKANFETEFVCIEDGIIIIYKYFVEISEDPIDNFYRVDKEELSYKNITAKKWTTVYLIEKGNLINSNNKKLFNKINKDNGLESLKDNTFLSYFVYKYFRNEIDKEDLENIEENNVFLAPLIVTEYFAFNLYIYLDDDSEFDKYVNDIVMYDYKNNPSKYNNKAPLTSRVSFSDEMINCASMIRKEDFKDYEDDIKKVFEFIQIFKPELKSIEIDKKDDHDYYLCELIFNYGDYKVNTAFESNGIKKLINLYKAIEAVDNGSIVFIDELDSNIHDVYLCRLIEYVEEYAKGQLCFTTHSITVMDVLENRKKSLDFLARDKSITSWFKNSHYAASKLYKKGFIEKSPFNIESFDFLRAFGESIDEL